MQAISRLRRREVSTRKISPVTFVRQDSLRRRVLQSFISHQTFRPFLSNLPSVIFFVETSRNFRVQKKEESQLSRCARHFGV